MIGNDDSLASFITWTVYGTHLQGHQQGWPRRKNGTQLPQPLLERWRQDRLKHPIVALDADMRVIVENEIERHCHHRGWHPWAKNARSNHVHVVVTAKDAKDREHLDDFHPISRWALAPGCLSRPAPPIRRGALAPGCLSRPAPPISRRALAPGCLTRPARPSAAGRYPPVV